MHLALSIMDLGCAILNGYWFIKAFRNPTVYPGWYCAFTGIMAVYCLIVTFI